MAISKIVSNNFPFIFVVVSVRKRVEKVEALIDTGFEGDIAVPRGVTDRFKVIFDHGRKVIVEV